MTAPAVACDPPNEIADGRVIFADLSYNSVARYECRYGFWLEGPTSRRCGSSRDWDGPEPVCKEIDCGHPGNLPNGFLDGRKTTLGSVIYFMCHEGMAFVGTLNSTTCMDTGTWSHPVPHCMAPCTVPGVDQGRVQGVPLGLKVPHGHGVNVTCRPNYEPLELSTEAKCFNGSWTHVPACGPGMCVCLFLLYRAFEQFHFPSHPVSSFPFTTAVHRKLHVKRVEEKGLRS